MSDERNRRPMRVGVIGVAVVAAIGVAFGIFGLLATQDDSEVEGRSVHITFDGAQCSVEAPLTLSEGEIEITYENTSQERVWGQVASLDDGFDGQDLIATLIEPTRVGPPPWAHGVWSHASLESGQTSVTDTIEVKEGYHVVVCGTWTPEYRGFFGSELRIHQ